MHHPAKIKAKKISSSSFGAFSKEMRISERLKLNNRINKNSVFPAENTTFRKHKLFKCLLIIFIISQIILIIIILFFCSTTKTTQLINENWFKWVTAISFLNFIFLIFIIYKKIRLKREIKNKYGNVFKKRKGTFNGK